jgi:hypothetical protein
MRILTNSFNTWNICKALLGGMKEQIGSRVEVDREVLGKEISLLEQASLK